MSIPIMVNVRAALSIDNCCGLIQYVAATGASSATLKPIAMAIVQAMTSSVRSSSGICCPLPDCTESWASLRLIVVGKPNSSIEKTALSEM